MLSDSDRQAVEKVLNMAPEELSKFLSELTVGAAEYLDVILSKYDQQTRKN